MYIDCLLRYALGLLFGCRVALLVSSVYFCPIELLNRITLSFVVKLMHNGFPRHERMYATNNHGGNNYTIDPAVGLKFSGLLTGRIKEQVKQTNQKWSQIKQINKC